MKTALIVLMTLFTIASLSAFQAGTLNPSGTLTFTNYHYNDNQSDTNLEFTPQLGFFLTAHLVGDVLCTFASYESKSTIGTFTEVSNATIVGFGAGGRYIENNYYAGFNLMHAITNSSLDKTANYVNLKCGYLVPIVKNVQFDLGLHYTIGLGKYGGDFHDIDNEERVFGFQAGLQVFIPTRK